MILTVPTTKGDQQEIVYDIDNFPYTKYAFEDCTMKKGVRYFNLSCAFDIESTTIKPQQNPDGTYQYTPQAFMYHWQFCIKDSVCFGRTWEEFNTFLERLENGLQLNSKRILIIYVHNLSYEFQFIKDFLQIDSLFAKDKRKVMKFKSRFFEWRCSYFLSNMSLLKFCENSQLCTHYKMVDEYDYSLVRTPKTALTSTELAYCYNDVRGLCECIDTLLLEDNIISIPLTNTGYVRREFRRNMNTPTLRKQFLKTALSAKEYSMLRRAFRGGNTHANRRYAGKKIKNVFSFDIQSSYPAVMLTDDYPVGKFTRVTLNTQEKLDKYCSKYCVVMDIEFFNISVKDDISIPYIDLAHCQKFSNYVNDNGRILSADYISMTITNIDLDIIRRTYNFDGLFVSDAMYSIKGKLPVEFRKTLMTLYQAKTELKDVEGMEYEYMKSKNRVNSGYGMTVTAIDHSEIIFDNNTWIEEKPDLVDALESYYKSRNSFLSYQWGVFVTANARKHLQDMLDVVNTDVIYTDTDSIKYINESNTDEFNRINERLIDIAINNDIPAYATDKKGVVRYLGIWDFDGFYKEFKTLGAKKYCYVSENKKGIDEFHITVSGMSKKLGAKVVGCIDNFEIGTTYNNIGRTTSWYNEESQHKITVNDCTFTTASNIGILESTYKLGITDEYFEILEKYVDIHNLV